MIRGTERIVTLLFIAVLLVLNTLFFYYVNCTGDYFQITDVYGRKYVENRAEEKRVSEILAIPDLSISLLENRISDCSKVIYAISIVKEFGQTAVEENKIVSEYAKNNGDLNIDELDRQVSVEKAAYEAALKKLEYVEGYTGYIKGIAKNASDISEIGIFKNEDWIKNNIIKTKKDFYGLENIRLSLTSDVATGILINYHISDIFALLSVFVFLPFFLALSKRMKSSMMPERKLLIIPFIATLFLSALIYSGNILMTQKYIGKIKLNIPVQSYLQLKSCPYTINTGTMIFACFSAKLVGIMFFSFFAIIVLCGIKSAEKISRFLAAFILVFVLLEIIAYFSGILGTFWREINIFSLFTFERFFIRYLNLNFFGAAVSRLYFMVGATVVIMSIMLTTMVYSISQYIKAARETAERNYFDELNHRYTESQKINHDINNHLLAVSRLIESGNIESAKKYISEVVEKTELSAQPLKTGSDVLDALLFKKSGQAKADGIKLDIEVKAPVPEGISDYDLCTIFGNILDNAFEAVSHSETEKNVRLTMSGQHEMFYISCENPFSRELKREAGKIVSIKPDKALHGYGLMRVSEIAEKYGGTVSVTDENKEFRIEILIIKK